MVLGLPVGLRIRERRLALGLSQAALARDCDISPSYLNLIEHGRRRIGGALLHRVAARLDLDPAVLAGASEDAVVAGLRALPGAGRADAKAPAEAVAARFPEWAAIAAREGARAASLEERNRALADRIAHDPQLSEALHAMVSAATAIRSSASILTEGQVDPDWQRRFLRNIQEDSLRLSTGAEELSRFLGADAEREGPLTAEEAAERWLAGDQRSTAPTGPAARLVRRALERAEKDAAALPADVLRSAQKAAGGDLAAVATRLGLSTVLVLRRTAALDPEVGIVLSDGSGAPLLRLPPMGFALPRSGPLCPLLPLFEALGDPGRPVAARLESPDGRLWDSWAAAERSWPMGTGGAPVVEAAMLIGPVDGEERVTRPIGPTCRLCPRAACPARREPAPESP